MNDVILQELKGVVEQAVRPVRATMARKRRMREELLAHLTAIFEEEVETLGDDQAALDQAKRRFGDSRELTGSFKRLCPDGTGSLGCAMLFSAGRASHCCASPPGLQSSRSCCCW